MTELLPETADELLSKLLLARSFYNYTSSILSYLGVDFKSG